MSKRNKKNKSYIKGLKDGAAPFENKITHAAKVVRNLGYQLDEIKRGQIKTQQITNQLIEGEQQNQSDIKELKGTLYKQEKSNSQSRQKIQNIELMMPSISTNCSLCGHPIESHQLVCSHCGAISNSFPYELSTFDIRKKCLAEVGTLSHTIKEADKRETNWLYPELDEKFIKMKKIQKIADQAIKEKKNAPAYEQIYKLTQKFFNDYEEKRIEIAVVGTVKAGKSSLINALIGAKLASVDAIPETSILAKYHTTSDQNYLKITFYTQEEWNRLWATTKNAAVFQSDYKRLNADKVKYNFLDHAPKYIPCIFEKLSGLMMEWSGSDSPKHFFVKEIEVGYKSDALPHDVFLVDTPGLSDPVAYRSEITQNYIKKADWILACISGENLSGQPEFRFLSSVSSYKGGNTNKIFVVATKKDMLSTKEITSKANEFLIRLGELYGSPSMAASRFFFIAAETHLLTLQMLHGIELDEDDTEKFQKALFGIVGLEVSNYPAVVTIKKDEILKYAGINDLFRKVNEDVLKNKRAYIINMILQDYNYCMKLINDSASTYLTDTEQILKKLTNDREYDQNQLEELQQDNYDLTQLLRQVNIIRNKLDNEIGIVNKYPLIL